MKKIIYWLLHISGCPDKDLKYEVNGKRAVCTKCDRDYFVFKSY